MLGTRFVINNSDVISKVYDHYPDGFKLTEVINDKDRKFNYNKSMHMKLLAYGVITSTTNYVCKWNKDRLDKIIKN